MAYILSLGFIAFNYTISGDTHSCHPYFTEHAGTKTMKSMNADTDKIGSNPMSFKMAVDAD